MQATAALREKMAQLLAADATTLAPATDANVVMLVKAPFTAAEQMVIGDLEPADFDGSTPLACGVGAQLEGLDPLTSDSLITLKSPIGGWRWETTGITNLPQTIYGFALTNDDGSILLAAEQLPTPIVLGAINQVFTLGAIGLRQIAGSLV